MKKLSTKTDEIRASISRIEANGAQRIDIDLCMQQIRELYEMLLQLQNNQVITVAKPVDTQPARKNEEILEFDRPIIESQDAKIEKNAAEEIIPVAEPVKPVEKAAQVKPKAEPEKTQQQSLFNGYTDTDVKTLGEQLGENKTSLNDILALKATQHDVASKLTAKPITDIKAAIGVGDRFLFIRELFDGDNDVFNKTVDHLNGLDSENEAMTYINNNFKWNADSATVKHFIGIVQRRYVK